MTTSSLGPEGDRMMLSREKQKAILDMLTYVHGIDSQTLRILERTTCQLAPAIIASLESSAKRCEERAKAQRVKTIECKI
jgi:hypothetical protein